MSGSYNRFKQHGGRFYTGMPVGGQHNWNYSDTTFLENPSSMHEAQALMGVDVRYDSVKTRARKAPKNSGAGVGTVYHWHIVADLTMKPAKNGQGIAIEIKGQKYKVGHKMPQWGAFSYERGRGKGAVAMKRAFLAKERHALQQRNHGERPVTKKAEPQRSLGRAHHKGKELIVLDCDSDTDDDTGVHLMDVDPQDSQDWRCARCTRNNLGSEMTCSACQFQRQTSKQEVPHVNTQHTNHHLGPLVSMLPMDWACTNTTWRDVKRSPDQWTIEIQSLWKPHGSTVKACQEVTTALSCTRYLLVVDQFATKLNANQYQTNMRGTKFLLPAQDTTEHRARILDCVMRQLTATAGVKALLVKSYKAAPEPKLSKPMSAVLPLLPPLPVTPRKPALRRSETKKLRAVDIDGVFYWPGALPESEADALLPELQHRIPWVAKQWRGRALPRMTWHYEPGVCAPLDWLLAELAQRFNVTVQGVFCNFYRNGTDYTPMHADQYGADVLSVSFGATRRFQFRENVGSRSASLDLCHGDVMLFTQAVNDQWKHTVPRDPSVTKGRINLTIFVTRNGALPPRPSQKGQKRSLSLMDSGLPPLEPAVPMDVGFQSSQESQSSASGDRSARLAKKRRIADGAGMPTSQSSASSASSSNFPLEVEAVEAVVVNRAPVLTLWIAVVARTCGHSWSTSLTLAKALSGIMAVSRGQRLGALTGRRIKSYSGKEEEALPTDAMPGYVTIMSRRLAVQYVEGEPRALDGKPGSDRPPKPYKPQAVQAYLERSFGDGLAAVQDAMTRLAVSYRTRDLDSVAYSLYERFRPSSGGWGQKGMLRVSDVLSLITPTPSKVN